MVDSSVDRLVRLYPTTLAINSSLNLTSVLEMGIDKVISSIHAERGFLMMFFFSRKLTFHKVRGMDHQVIMSTESQVFRQVVDYVAKPGGPLLANNAQKDSCLDRSQCVFFWCCDPFFVLHSSVKELSRM